MSEHLLYGASIDYSFDLPSQALRLMVKRQLSGIRAVTKRWVRKYNSSLVGDIQYELIVMPYGRNCKRLWLYQVIEVRRTK